MSPVTPCTCITAHDNPMNNEVLSGAVPEWCSGSGSDDGSGYGYGYGYGEGYGYGSGSGDGEDSRVIK